MPRKYAKKSVVRRRRKRKRKQRIPTPYQGLIVAPRQLVKFKYSTFVQIDASSSTAVSAVYRANGLYDPEGAAGGAQPTGTDHWAQFYTHFTVIGAKCTATFLPSSDSVTLTPQWVGITCSGSSTLVSSDPEAILDQKWTSKKMLTTSDSKGYTKVTKNLSIKKYLGVRNLIDDRANAGVFNSADPAEQVYFHVFCAPYSGFYDPVAVNIPVTIEYIAILHEPKQQAPSS